MNDSAVRMVTGASNAPWMANVTKIGHPSASVTVLKYETTVFIFHSANLIRKSYRVRVCCHYREVEEAGLGFYSTVGKACELGWRDHLYLVLDDNPRSEQKHRMKFNIPFMDVADVYLQDRRDYNRFTADPKVTQDLAIFAKHCADDYIKTYEPDRLRDTRPKFSLD